MADYQTAEARILADLERVPVVTIKALSHGDYGWECMTETDGYRWVSKAHAASAATRWARSLGLPEPVLILPDGTQIAASDFLAREGGAH